VDGKVSLIGITHDDGVWLVRSYPSQTSCAATDTDAAQFTNGHLAITAPMVGTHHLHLSAGSKDASRAAQLGLH
jgi:hypothetical protein